VLTTTVILAAHESKFKIRVMAGNDGSLETVFNALCIHKIKVHDDE
jgi:hypothetical protein